MSYSAASLPFPLLLDQAERTGKFDMAAIRYHRNEWQKFTDSYRFECKRRGQRDAVGAILKGLRAQIRRQREAQFNPQARTIITQLQGRVM